MVIIIGSAQMAGRVGSLTTGHNKEKLNNVRALTSEEARSPLLSFGEISSDLYCT